MSLFGSSSPPKTFPEVRATDLDGNELTLPADLPAPLALVIVLFRDGLDPLADQWARLGDEIAGRCAGRMTVVETPVVGRGMKLFGSLATVGIRNQVDDEREHARTLPIYVDKKTFRKALKLSNENGVHVYLVLRETGEIRWSGEDAIDMHEVQGLEEAAIEAVATISAAPPPEAEPDASETSPAMAPRDTPGGLAAAGESTPEPDAVNSDVAPEASGERE